MTRDASEGVSSTPQVIDAVDDGNCQSDRQLPGMMVGSARLPHKLERFKSQQKRIAIQSAQAQALRKTTNEEPK